MLKLKLKNAAKEHILTQSRNNDEKFSKFTVTENSNLKYSDQEYSDPVLLVFESENSNREEFNNEKTELNKKTKQLIYKNSSFYNLKWDNKASGSQLLYYSGGSKHTQQQKNKDLQKVAQGSISLNNFFKLIKKLKIEYKMSDSNISDLDVENNSSSLEQLYKLNNKLKDTKNINNYEYLHLLAIYKYLTAIFNNYKEFQLYIKLSLKILQKHYVQNNVLLYVTSSHISILLETARIWLHHLGLVYQLHQQGIYYNGHKHSDIVQYHTVFLEKIKNLETLMLQFVGEDMKIVINPEISEEQQVHIFVTHDECTFYTNDSYPSVWTPLGMPPLHKKEIDKSLMVSEFLTETYDHLTITLKKIDKLNLLPIFLQEACVIIKPDKNDKGWWNGSNLLTQVANKAIPIFEATHLNCIGVFIFNNSTNHSAFANDMLCAKKITFILVVNSQDYAIDSLLMNKMTELFSK
ncbi:3058_t:CDS:2 [Cetraspora pellucida]|uniref:3058_t:CDS:1 n=1 Tax=Cetraspora pellucida TaxID=1433469 RepID=A0A9N9PC16_9GLOM|nr:3058_t:CDS:2 [Cetraspora pellucida]